MFYSLFGLLVSTNLPVPGLVETNTRIAPDITIRLDSTRSWIQNIPGIAKCHWHTSSSQDEQGRPLLEVCEVDDGSHFHFAYHDGTQFLVDRTGHEIYASWPDTLTLEDTATYLLGPVFGFVLRLRGVVCLHAGAVAVDDGAIALLGPTGAGKSTTVAAFAKAGNAVLSDNITALRDGGHCFKVLPAYPRIRLWPESVDALCGSPDALPKITPNWDKRCLDLVGNEFTFQQQPLPLRGVYILSGRSDNRADPFIEAVTDQGALMSLITNSYAGYLLDRSRRAEEFDILSRVASRVPIRRVVPHTDLRRLPALRTAIIEDFRKLTQAASGTKGQYQVV